MRIFFSYSTDFHIIYISSVYNTIIERKTKERNTELGTKKMVIL